ncbi:MAG: hypothetical protein WC489_06695 [Patescibacteria group bacterium]
MFQNPEPPFFSTEQKPQLEDSIDYFRTRLIRTTDQFEMPVQSTDAFGNTVWASSQFEEIGLKQRRLPATLAMTDEGRLLCRMNPRLLRQIASGSIDGELIGEGDEGKVYKVTLQTDHGPCDFAVKYTFPIVATQESTGRVIHSFTPRVDDMRVMQWIIANLGEQIGFQYALPLIATNDIAVAPYIADTIPLYLILETLSDNPPQDLQKFPQFKELLNTIQKDQKEVAKYEGFSYQFIVHVQQGLSFLYRELEKAFREKRIPHVQTMGPLFEFMYREENILVPFSLLSQLYDKYKPPTGITPKNQEEFKKEAQQACIFIETMIGRDDY